MISIWIIILTNDLMSVAYLQGKEKSRISVLQPTYSTDKKAWKSTEMFYGRKALCDDHFQLLCVYFHVYV